MHRLLLPLAALLLLVPATPAAAASCVRPGDRVVARSPTAVVVQRGEERTIGCLRAEGRRRVLHRGYRTDTGDSEVTSLVRVAGRFAAYAITIDQRGPRLTVVVVADLRTGSRRTSVMVAPTGLSPETVSGLALAADGTALVAGGTADGEQLVVVDGNRRRVLDEGPERTIGALALRDGRATWRRDGRPREARLDAPDRCGIADRRRLSGTLEAVVVDAGGCVRATGAWTYWDGVPLAARGTLVAVQDRARAIRVFDLRTRAPIGPPVAATAGGLTLLARSGTLVLQHPAERLVDRRLELVAPDGTRTDLGTAFDVRLVDDVLSWRGADGPRSLRI